LQTTVAPIFNAYRGAPILCCATTVCNPVFLNRGAASPQGPFIILSSVEHDPVPDRDPTGFCNSEPDPDRTGFRKTSTGSDMDIQTALITAVKCLIRGLSWLSTVLNQIFGLYYRIRIGLDYTIKRLDWIRIAKSPIRSTLTLRWAASQYVFWCIIKKCIFQMSSNL